MTPWIKFADEQPPVGMDCIGIWYPKPGISRTYRFHVPPPPPPSWPEPPTVPTWVQVYAGGVWFDYDPPRYWVPYPPEENE